MHHNIVYLYHGIKIVTLNHDTVIVYYESNNVSIIKFVKHNFVMVFAKDNLFRLSQMIPKHHIVSYWFCTFLFVNFLNDNVIAFFVRNCFIQKEILMRNYTILWYLLYYFIIMCKIILGRRIKFLGNWNNCRFFYPPVCLKISYLLGVWTKFNSFSSMKS